MDNRISKDERFGSVRWHSVFRYKRSIGFWELIVEVVLFLTIGLIVIFIASPLIWISERYIKPRIRRLEERKRYRHMLRNAVETIENEKT